MNVSMSGPIYGDAGNYENHINIVNKRRLAGLATYSIGFTHKDDFTNFKDAIDWVHEIKPGAIATQFATSYVSYHWTTEDTILELVKQTNDRVFLTVWGSRDFVESWVPWKRDMTANPTLTWSYMQGDGKIVAKELSVTDVDVAKDAYYPWIEGGVDAYIDSFLKSKAPILLLLGEPGTGKTSFIRYLIKKHNLNTAVTFDQNVMKTDSYFIDYLCSTSQKLMVLEDADLILEDRDSGQNGLMSKLLNVSDGIIKLEKKKIIFTTNLKNLENVDAALTRPGRCYDVLNFRTLTYDEALAVCDAAGLPEMSESRREYTLSEVFNNKRQEPVQRRRKVGFTS